MTTTVSHLDVPLEEMQGTYTSQLAGIDTIKTTIRTIFGAASLIVSLASALQVFAVRPVPADWLNTYQNGIVFIAVLYLALIIVCIAGMWPVYIWRPLLPEWDVLTTVYKGLDEEQTKAKKLSSLLNAIELNQPVVTRFYRLQVTALILLPLLVLLLLLLAWIPRA
jgi:hypothetical protein